MDRAVRHEVVADWWRIRLRGYRLQKIGGEQNLNLNGIKQKQILGKTKTYRKQIFKMVLGLKWQGSY